MKTSIRRIPEMLSRLESLLQLRDIREGFALLGELRKELKSSGDLNGPIIIPLALCLAQWMDLGYRDDTIFKMVVGKLPRRHAEMPFLDVMKLNLIEAFSCLSGEDLNRAIMLLDQTSIAGAEMMPEYLVFLTHFLKGRAHRKRGDYKNAALHIQAAKDSAERLENPRLVAVTKIHESWLDFQNGDLRRGLQLLDEAEDRAQTRLGMRCHLGTLNLPGTIYSPVWENTRRRSGISKGPLNSIRMIFQPSPEPGSGNGERRVCEAA